MNEVWPFEFWRYVPIFLAAPAQTAFIIIYSLRVFGAGTWWRTFVGRALFTKSITVAILINSAAMAIILRAFNNGYTYVSYDFVSYGSFWEAVVNVGYWAVCFAIYYQLFALINQRWWSYKNREDS